MKYFRVNITHLFQQLLFLFQDYSVLNMLGRGGFACVYRARSLLTGVEVAIKMVSILLEYLYAIAVHVFLN